MDGGSLDDVVVVEDKDKGLGEGCDFVHQRGQDRFVRRQLGGSKQRVGGLSKLYLDLPQRSQQIAQKTPRVVVAFD